MRSYLQTVGCWQIINGNQPKPAMLTLAPPNVTCEHVDGRNTDIRDWIKGDNQGVGAIMLCISGNLQHLGAGQNSSEELWDALRTALGTLGPALIFTDFKAVTSIWINAQTPISDIMKLSTIFGRLTTNNIGILELIKAMILIAAIPRNFDNLASTILQQYDVSTLTFTVVRDAIVAESQRRYAAGPSQQPIINKIPTVKQKGANPRWQSSQNQGDKHDQPQLSNDKGKGKTTRGKCAGKSVKNNDRGHLMSVASEQHAPTPFISAPVTTITGSGSTIRPTLYKHLSTLIPVPNPLPLPISISTKDLRKQQPMQCYISMSPNSLSSSSVYPDYQRARDALEGLDLAKMAKNIKLIEITFSKREGKKRKIEHESNEDTVSLESETEDVNMEEAPTKAAILETVTRTLSVDTYNPEREQNDYDYLVENSGYDDRSVILYQNKQNAHVKLPASSLDLSGSDLITCKYVFGTQISREHPNGPYSCLNCENKNCEYGADWIMDSGASNHFTVNLSDFTSYEEIALGP